MQKKETRFVTNHYYASLSSSRSGNSSQKAYKIAVAE